MDDKWKILPTIIAAPLSDGEKVEINKFNFRATRF